jgi:hypothetical protein
LASQNQPIVFGPFEINPIYGSVVNNTMNYIGRAPGNFQVSATAASSISYQPTATQTHTPQPRPTSTWTPIFTNTPTNTPIPVPPTPTPTPTFTPITPTPTPTRSYAISLLETPTPRGQAAGLPPGVTQQNPALQSTPDPAQQGFPAPQSPLQEPALATATQIAVDATTTAIAATSTTIAAEATASQLAIDGAAATALAETQATLPDSPLPTPTLDPTLFPQGDTAGFPIAPGVGITGTPESMATGDRLPEVPAEGMTAIPGPGAIVPIMPPAVTAIIPTATITTPIPAVVVLVVTNTPDPALAMGGTLPDGQRPIVYPTPTATPDLVMAAARTFDVAVATMGWLWFLVGSLIFFVTAGIVAGLFFRQSEVNRYDLPEPEYWLEEEPPPDRPRTTPTTPTTGQGAEDDWPADLP